MWISVSLVNVNMSSLAIPATSLPEHRFSIGAASHDESFLSAEAEGGARSAARRRHCARIGLVLSTVAIASGLISVLAVVKFCIAPELRTHRVIYARCRLISHAAATGRPGSTGELIRKEATSPRLLLPVLYRAEYGSHQLGWLSASCRPSAAVTCTHSRNYTKSGEERDRRTRPPRTAGVGRPSQSVPCFYMERTNQVQRSDPGLANPAASTQPVHAKGNMGGKDFLYKLGAILSPTVVFIAGFVGLFFSCVSASYRF